MDAVYAQFRLGIWRLVWMVCVFDTDRSRFVRVFDTLDRKVCVFRTLGGLIRG